MTDKDKYITLLRSTGRKGIEELISYLENSNFFTAKCHSHHLWKGGLCEHSLEAYDIARAMFPGADRDSLIIVCLCHDLCSAFSVRSRHIHGHGRRSAGILADLCKVDITDDERTAIANHMHAYKAPGCSLAWIVSLADRGSCMLHGQGRHLAS